MWRQSLWLTAAVLAVAGAACAAETSYPLPVLPAEHKMMKDPVTGADLIFVTTNPAEDHNLYFHERSWLADSSLLLFTSSRPDGGLMGYLFATGELVRITTPKGGVGGATAARDRNSVFALRGREVLELALKIEPSRDPAKTPSKVTATERVICSIPDGMSANTALNENADGTLLSLGVNQAAGVGIIVVNVKTGQVRLVCRLPGGAYAGHLQFSHTSPNLISYAGVPERLMIVDVNEGKPRAIHPQVKGETVTHECWWVNDQLTYCGGYVEGQSHVNVINIFTGEVRIIGAGSWSPEATPAELARWNWWHASGHDSGRWVAADNWHGDIALFDGKTARIYRLTLNHRTYGHGTHPEVGWDRRGERVVFTSHMLGNPDVCVATIPEAWQREARAAAEAEAFPPAGSKEPRRAQ
jgi:oligogalacturonide lyase